MNEMVTTGGASPSPTREIEALTPEQLGGEIRLLTAQARRMALSYGIQIGYRLRVAHDKVGPHGWAEWLKRETDFSAAAASRFEKLYEGYGAEQGGIFGVENKFPTLEKISISNALRLLAVPKEERAEVAAQVDAEHISARELERALAERDEARKALRDLAESVGEQKEKILRDAQDDRRFLEDKLQEAEKEADRLAQERVELLGKLDEAERAIRESPLQAQLTEAQKQIRELESRPVEVAVERDEAIKKAADAARKAAEEKAAGDLDKLRKKLEAAEKAREKAETEAREAGSKNDGILRAAQDDRDKLAAEAEALRKKLVSAESGANVVGALFSLAQQNFNSALEKVVAMKATHPDVAEKLLAGMEQILSGLVEKVKEAQG